jgi:alkylresorcinol/alkylpyrone synthase
LSVAPSVLSVATALPPYRIGQDAARDFARALFGGAHQNIERLLPIFENSGVEGRNFCVPVEWFSEEHSFPERNEIYVENALDLSEKSARRALDRAGVGPGEIGAIFFVSTTGLSTPSIDSKLIFRLGLSKHVRRVPIWGLGCSGGAAGLAHAAEYLRAFPEKKALLVAVELSGLTFQAGDLSKANLVSTALFGDGASAVVLGDGDGPQVVGGHSTTWAGTEDVRGWELVATGLKVKLSKSVPTVVQEKLRPDLELACESAGIEFSLLKHFLLHPAGAKVLDTFEKVLELPSDRLSLSREVLRECGNMSCVTAIAILERFLQRGECAEGDLGVITAMGPGFSAEHVFFKC